MRKLLAVVVLTFATLLTASAQDHPDTKRTHKIQAALVRAGYLKHVTNQWDDKTEAALRTLQQDHGWQHKIVPDSRAIIFLNLGPDYSHALNADSCAVSFALPQAPKTSETPIIAALR